MKNITARACVLLVTIISGQLCADRFQCELWSEPNQYGVEPGGTVQLNCAVTSVNGVQTLTWLKNNANIPYNPANITRKGLMVYSSAISLRNVSRADSGKYTCRATREKYPDHDCRVVNTPFKFLRLNVFAPPHIKVEPSSRYREVIQSTMFMTCEAFGYPAPDVRWTYNNLTVEDGASGETFMLTKQRDVSSCYLTLRVLLATVEKSGTYSCIANNSRGTDTYDVQLKIRDPKPVAWSKQLISVAKPGQNVTLRCLASDVFQTETKAEWWYNSTNLSNHREEFFPNDTLVSTLTILDVSDSNAGEYWCQVKVYSITSKVVKMRLILAEKGLPLVATDSSHVSASLGSRLTLYCTVTYPEYDVAQHYWTKNGTELSSQSKPARYTLLTSSPSKISHANKEIVTLSLTIKNFTLSDVGVFSCLTTSLTGHNWTSIYVSLPRESGVAPGPSSSFHDVLIILMTLGSTLGFVILITLRYLYHKRKRFRRGTDHDNQEYIYETFLTFNCKDFDWVKSKLIPLLEKYTFNYCISGRDFEIGKAIIDNIAQSVYKSRTVIAVLSKDYLSSKLCQDELDIALYRSAERDDNSLIIVRIDTVDKSQIPKALRNRTFLDYTDLEERKHWERRLLKYLFAHRPKTADKSETVF